jgi:hypothetical protein
METMVTTARIAIAAALVWAAPAFAQSAQDHEAHHPDNGATVQQPSQPAPMQRVMPGPNMMGPGRTVGGTMPMMNMMMGMQNPAEHIEGHLAFIQAELKITDGQAQQWNAFADAVRGNANLMTEMRKTMMAGQGAPSTLPERLAREENMVTAHLGALKKTEQAVAQLYAVLTDEQKKVADKIVLGPMGMPMGMM